MCGHLTQDAPYRILYSPATDSFHRSLFGDSFSLYDVWPRPWGVAWLLELLVFCHSPIPRRSLATATALLSSLGFYQEPVKLFKFFSCQFRVVFLFLDIIRVLVMILIYSFIHSWRYKILMQMRYSCAFVANFLLLNLARKLSRFQRT